MEIAFLGSGSSGNCAVIRAGRTAVLLDAGLSVRDTARRLAGRGLSLDDVSALLLTHEHSDHVRAAADFARRRGLPIYATAGTARQAGLPGPLFADTRVVAGGDELSIGGELFVRVTRTPHDGEESVCFVFSDGDGRRIGVATDLGHLSRDVADVLRGCEVIGLESNHDVDLLRDGPYPAFLKRRILSDVGHLSNDAAAAGLRELVTERTRHVAALHVSRQNNTFALAERVFSDALAVLGAPARLSVARPDVATEWLGA
ncbi:MAG TPA: MBL fold metallo-hydrolase [Thermoanaerobaculia bacterium]|nr:MBL fold metallo-hydrolase [Thermoanaerobaculia bacterium]HQR67374.1 MBL fold metallo-hydrolase [Thermoanaerobaculia bacterium]